MSRQSQTLQEGYDKFVIKNPIGVSQGAISNINQNKAWGGLFLRQA